MKKRSAPICLCFAPLLVTAAVALLLTLSASAQSPPSPLLSGDPAQAMRSNDEIAVEVAEKIAKHCLEFANAHKARVNIAVVNALGHMVYNYRMNGALPVDVDTSLRKAQTVIYTRMSTDELTKRYARMPGGIEVWMLALGQFPSKGGVPIMLNGAIIGAVGVGGGSGAEDHQCAYDAITAVVGPQPAPLPAS